jgi:predicted nucleic acid-binding protein
MSEASNTLLMAQRRGRIDRETMQERLALLDMLPIETDDAVCGTVWRSSVLTLADVEALSFYDAIYLELAIRRGLPLASSDAALCRAARRRGVVVLPPEPR